MSSSSDESIEREEPARLRAAQSLVAELRDRGIRLSVRGGNLVVDAPAGALSPELRERLKAMKPDLLRLLAQHSDASPTLAFSQERIAYLEMLEPGTSVYNLPAIFDVKRELSVDEIVRCMAAMCERHESLRSRFRMSDEGLSVRLPSLDREALRGVVLPLADADAERELINRPIPLESGFLFRVGVGRSESSTTLVFVFHHAIMDGLSVKRFGREFFELIGSGTDGAGQDMNGAPGFYEFAREQKEAHASRRDEQVEFWRRYLHGFEEHLTILAEADADAPQRGDRVRALVPKADAEKLRAHAATRGSTLFQALLAVYALALEVVSRQKDFVIGVAVDGRTGTAYERSLGLFINTIPLRVHLADAATFDDLLAAVGVSVVATLPYQDTPLELIVQAADVRRTTEHTPLYQAMLSFQDRTQADLPAWVERRAADIDAARLELTLFADYVGEGIALSLEFDTGRVSRTVATRLLGIVTATIGEVSAEPGIALAKLRGAAIRSIGDDRSRCHGPMLERAAPFLESFERTVERVPADAVAVACGTERLTYRELADAGRRLGAFLRAQGVRPRDTVGIHLGRGTHLSVAILGVWYAGAAYLPLDPEFPSERLKFMVRDAGACVVVSEVGLDPEGFADVPTVSLDAADGSWRDASPADGAPRLGEADPAYILYTSGSTGRPKGVVVPHRAVANFLAAMRREPGLGEAESLLAVTTVSFDISVLELLLPLTVGARVVVATSEESSDGAALRALAERERITVMQATPSTWRLLLDAGWQGAESFRCLCGGEPFPLDLKGPLTARSAEVWNMYGPTETTVWSACGRLRPEEPISVGRPVANTSIFVLDDDGNELPAGLAGEVWIGGAGVALGYHNRAELTAERFRPAGHLPVEGLVYRTGDLGRWTESGALEILGRLDDQVKIRGFRIELSEIEAGLAACANVRRAAVTVWDHEPDDRRLVAYIVAEPGCDVSGIELRKELRNFLPSYMIPQHFVTLDELPTTPNGKLDRRALPPPTAAQGVARSDTAERPATDTEKRVAAIWGELIGGAQVMREDNFFDAGGHSLLAIRAIARMEQEFGWRPSPRDLILGNLREIAARCEAASGEQGRDSGLLSRIKDLVGGD